MYILSAVSTIAALSSVILYECPKWKTAFSNKQVEQSAPEHDDDDSDNDDNNYLCTNCKLT